MFWPWTFLFIWNEGKKIGFDTKISKLAQKLNSGGVRMKILVGQKAGKECLKFNSFDHFVQKKYPIFLVLAILTWGKKNIPDQIPSLATSEAEKNRTGIC